MSASAGIRTWLIQRISAVFLALYLLVFLVALLLDPPSSYSVWLDVLKSPVVTVALVLFLVFLLAHSWVGLRDVVMDYIKPMGLRLSLLALLGTYLAACLIYGVSILMRTL
ncbi:MAG: succinate dehydrogenase, hydrophobic membrane anchor protein [Gammaproteobacteria bacterium]|nr:succinate dehydrogenase, hydrophobic membrane anchor protein [Gammaproteobacteria bacterium]MDH5801022.1 succinate dehydrogenase, hydrophobic membrane anchor protein [Gammaproteobacteria bacterium]